MLNIIREKNGMAIVEIENKFYVVKIDRNRGQVYSAMPSDCPASGTWFGGLTEGGIKYVASGRSRSAAVSGFNRVIRSADIID